MEASVKKRDIIGCPSTSPLVDWSNSMRIAGALCLLVRWLIAQSALWLASGLLHGNLQVLYESTWKPKRTNFEETYQTHFFPISHTNITIVLCTSTGDSLFHVAKPALRPQTTQK